MSSPPGTNAPEPSSVVDQTAAAASAEPVSWVNGERQPTGGAQISARDRGLTLADGVFETMRAHAGTVFRLDRHLARLEQALVRLEIPQPADLREWVSSAVSSAVWADLSIRLTVTRGVAPGGVAAPTHPDPTVIVTVGPFPIFPAPVYEKGLTCAVVSGRRNEFAMTAGLKTLAYTDSVAALIEARRMGADEALFLDTQGHCSEGTASNLFVLLAGTLVTPPFSCGALPGITRAAILEIAAASGVPVAERPFGVSDLVLAEEAFFTSSLRGVAPLTWLGPQRIGRGTPGLLTHRLMTRYAALVKQECGGGRA